MPLNHQKISPEIVSAIVFLAGTLPFVTSCGDSSSNTPSPSQNSDVTPSPQESSTQQVNTPTLGPVSTNSPSPVLTPSIAQNPSETPTAVQSSSEAPTPSLGQASESSAPTPTIDVNCQPPLSVSSENLVTLPIELTTINPAGGTGSYRYQLTQNESGGTINPSTGAYLSGSLGGTTDSILITDTQCLGQSSVSVSVVNPLAILPLAPVIPPDTPIAFEVSEGSGDYSCLLVIDGSGGNVDSNCNYQGGEASGFDVITVTDHVTHQYIDVVVEITPSATIDVSPATLYIPLGGSFPLSINGGSGHYRLEADEAIVESDNSYRLTALSPGETTLHVLDKYTDIEQEIQVSVAQPLGFEHHRSGSEQTCSHSLSPGDINQDGYADVILAHCESNLAAYNAGAVFIYAGTENGLAPQPAQIFTGEQWDDEFGSAIALEDVDYDGWPDLLIGSPANDLGEPNSGAIFIFKGSPEGFFEDEPNNTLYGTSSDNLGHGIGLCDFNDDGYIDIVAGTPFAEDRDAETGVQNTGASYFFLGSATGFSDQADQIIYAKTLDSEGQWQYQNNSRIGTSLVTGDFNGDQHCDLAIGGYEFAIANQSNSGSAMIYLGPGIIGDDNTVVEEPSFAIDARNHGDGNGHFARQMSVGDVNGDGIDDLLFAQSRRGGLDGSSTAGAARLFLGGESFGNLGGLIDVAEADWSTHGANPSDFYGWSVEIGNLNDDNYDDILVTALQGELSDGAANTGLVSVYLGTQSLPSSQADYEVLGQDALRGDYFGQSASFFPDKDGDGLGEVFAFAGRSDELGTQAGRAFLIYSDSVFEKQALEMPGNAAGVNFGRRSEFVGDINNDGQPELLVGAPLADPDSDTTNWGGVYGFSADSEGFEGSSTLEFTQLLSHSSADQLGYGIAYLGDFTGDSQSEFALVSAYEDRPKTFDEIYQNPDECPGSLNNIGSVQIFSTPIGSAEGVIADFVFFGPDLSGPLQSIIGNFDFNGDGLQDFAVSSPQWDIEEGTNAGGIAVIYGRAHSGDGPIIICEPDVLLPGWGVGDQMGFSLEPIGDSNSDGCDDIAAGAYLGDANGLSNQGQVTILYGSGLAPCPSSPQMATIAGGYDSGRFGTSLASGQDLNNDGIWDLAVGAPMAVQGTSRTGLVTILSGQAIGDLSKEDIQNTSPSLIHDLQSADPLATIAGIDGGDEFGSFVELIPPLTLLEGPGILISSPESSEAGPDGTGAVKLFSLTARDEDSELSPRLAAIITGDSSQRDTEMGTWISSTTFNGHLFAAISAYKADGPGVDLGAVYTVDLGMVID